MKLIFLPLEVASYPTGWMLGCQEFLIYLGVDTITLSISDPFFPHPR